MRPVAPALAALLLAAALMLAACNDERVMPTAGTAGTAGGAASAGRGGGAPPDGGAGTDGATAGTGGGAAGTGGATAGTGGGAAGTGGATAGTGGGASGTGGGAGTGGGDAAGTGGAATGGAGGGGATTLPCEAAWPGDVQIGTPMDDQILGMTIDADDNIIVSGYEQGILGVTNIEPDGNARAVVMKYGPAGTMSWRAVLDTPGTDTAEDVAIDPATGTLVVLGRTSGAFPTFVNQGQFDLVLAALSPDGQLATMFQTGNERPQHPARVSVGPGGAIAVAGWDDTYIDVNHVAAQMDGFVGRFTIDEGPGHGVSQASLQYTLPPRPTGPFSMVTGAAVDTDGSGDVYVTNMVALNNFTDHGIFVTKLRADHSVAWSETISTLASDAVNAVALSPAGDLFVTGGTFLAFGPNASEQEEAFLLKIDRATGALVWAVEGGGPGTDYPTALAFDRSGNIYIAGITTGSVVDGVVNQGSFDIFAMKFSPNGERLAAWQRGTATFDQITSMAVDRCGRVFVGGFTGGVIVPGRASAGRDDMFIMKADLR